MEGMTNMVDWSKPVAVSDLDVGMGARDMCVLLPQMKDIPEDFKSFFGRGEANKWVKIVDDMFFRGVKKIEIMPKEGVNSVIAMRHLKAILHSWESSHEHKTAGVAYLMSLWFDDFKYEVAE